MKKFLQWLALSSQNATQISLTVKGIALGVIPTIVLIAGLVHINLGANDLTNIVDGAASIIQYGLGAIAAIMTVYGLIRKIITSLTGSNAVVTAQKMGRI